MPSEWILFVSIVLLSISLLALARLGILKSLIKRPAIIVCVSVTIGIAYRFAGLPMSDPEYVSTLADAFLAMLVFAAALQFRLSTLHKHCVAALRLAIIAGPVFLVAASMSAFVLLPSLTIWSALIIGAALMLNGATIDRRIIIDSSVSTEVKSTVAIESAACLAIGLPLVMMIETAALTPFGAQGNAFEAGIFDAAIGFTIGGTLGLLGGRAFNWLRRRNPRSRALYFSVGVGIAAFLFAPMLGGSAIIAAGAAGLIWSEEAHMKSAERLFIFRHLEQLAKPAAYAMFGVILGPRLLFADTLIVFFALSAVTLLRVVPRLVALQPLALPTEERSFLAWFGGAPGAASALYLLGLIDSPAIADQEMVMTIGATSIVIGILGTRLSSRPLAKYFIRRAALARKRRFYA